MSISLRLLASNDAADYSNSWKILIFYLHIYSVTPVPLAVPLVSYGIPLRYNTRFSF